MQQSSPNKTIHTVFFGTSTIASTVLQALIDAPDISVDLVITQPDRPVGRKKVLTPPPVKILAQEHNIPVHQPESLNNFKFQISNFQIGTLAEYGMMVPQNIINIFPKGIVNVHPSLLPQYRGATPIQSAIKKGDEQTGVSLMLLEKTMDTGSILAQEEYRIPKDALYPAIQADLAAIGASMLVKYLPLYIGGGIVPTPQDDTSATYCSQLSRDDGKVNWMNTTKDIYNQYRAFTPWPGTWTLWNDKRIKLLKISPSDQDIQPGVLQVQDATLFGGTKDGAIEIHELQLEGKKPMDAKTFVQGFGGIDGAVLL